VGRINDLDYPLKVNHGSTKIFYSRVDGKSDSTGSTVESLHIIGIKLESFITSGYRGFIIFNLNVTGSDVKVETKLDLSKLGLFVLTLSLFVNLSDLIIIDTLLLPLGVAADVVPKDRKCLFELSACSLVLPLWASSIIIFSQALISD
jgi:uncharacterized membrane protein